MLYIYIYTETMPQCICCTSWIEQPKTPCFQCGYSNLNYEESNLKKRPWEIPVSVVTRPVDVPSVSVVTRPVDVPHEVDVQSDWVYCEDDYLNEYVLADIYAD